MQLSSSPLNNAIPLSGGGGGGGGMGSWSTFANELHVVDEEGGKGVLGSGRSGGTSRSGGRGEEMLGVVDEEGRDRDRGMDVRSGGRSRSRGRMIGRD